MALNTYEGIAVSLIGLGIVTCARRLALLPRRWRGFYTRHPSLKPPTALYSETGVRVLTLFWWICGAFWLVGGALLFRNPSHTTPFPWLR